jgi:hypothetical protein
MSTVCLKNPLVKSQLLQLRLHNGHMNKQTQVTLTQTALLDISVEFQRPVVTLVDPTITLCQLLNEVCDGSEIWYYLYHDPKAHM